MAREATTLTGGLLILALLVGGAGYVVLFWKPCICKYSFVQHCPRHGWVRDDDGRPLVDWLR
jgi:hypothetical protein